MPTTVDERPAERLFQIGLALGSGQISSRAPGRAFRRVRSARVRPSPFAAVTARKPAAAAAAARALAHAIHRHGGEIGRDARRKGQQRVGARQQQRVERPGRQRGAGRPHLQHR
jgi:hypothetical protein